jgi:hypothetical protein
MPTDLTQKFTDLAAQLLTQHQTLISALTATNQKLDALITAMGAPPPTQAVTLADVLQVLSDIHLDTMSLDQKLLRIRDAIAPLDEPLPPGDKVSIAWSMYRLVDSVAPPWPRPLSIPLQPAFELLRANLAESIGIFGTHSPEPILQLLFNLQRGMGLPTGDATTTALGYLSQIANQTKCGCGPLAPQPGDPNGCASPIESEISVVEAGRLYATWASPLPAGTTRTNQYTLSRPDIEISPATTWEGWRLFVLSRTAATYQRAPGRPGRFYTNEWLDLEPLNFPLAISVDESADVQAYLCAPAPLAGGGCDEVAGNTVVVFGDGTNYAVVWSNGTSSVNRGVDGFGDPVTFTANAAAFLTVDWHNRYFKVVRISGDPNPVVLYYYRPSEQQLRQRWLNETSYVQMTDHTDVVFVRSLNGAPFMLEICESPPLDPT